MWHTRKKYPRYNLKINFRTVTLYVECMPEIFHILPEFLLMNFIDINHKYTQRNIGFRFGKGSMLIRQQPMLSFAEIGINNYFTLAGVFGNYKLILFQRQLISAPIALCLSAPLLNIHQGHFIKALIVLLAVSQADAKYNKSLPKLFGILDFLSNFGTTSRLDRKGWYQYSRLLYCNSTQTREH